MTYPEPGPHPTPVTVYTKPDCVQCDQTKRWLNRHNIDYSTVDVTENPTALDYIKNTLGYSSAPVVTAWPEHLEDPIHWAGFQPGKLEQLTERK